MKKLLVLFTGLVLALTGRASSPFTLSDFSGFTPDLYGFDSSWTPATALSGPDSFTIADFGNGTPVDFGSFTSFLGSPQDFSEHNYVNLSGSAFTGNNATSFSFFLMDSHDGSGVATFQMADFLSGYSSVSLEGLWSQVDAANIVSWGFTTENQFGDQNFAFTFDKVTLSAAPAAIPEPSAYAAMAGGLSLFVAALAHRRRRASV